MTRFLIFRRSVNIMFVNRRLAACFIAGEASHDLRREQDLRDGAQIHEEREAGVERRIVPDSHALLEQVGVGQRAGSCHANQTLAAVDRIIARHEWPSIVSPAHRQPRLERRAR